VTYLEHVAVALLGCDAPGIACARVQDDDVSAGGAGTCLCHRRLERNREKKQKDSQREKPQNVTTVTRLAKKVNVRFEI
jgi:hypothetical protein